MKQRDDVGGDAGVFHQRRPHIILRIRHADLPQETRDGANERDVAPHQPRRQHQRVITVVLGGAAHHHQERGFQMRLGDTEIDRSAVAALEQHVVEPDFRRALAFRIDQERALINHSKTHVFQHGNAFRQRQWTFAAPDFEPDRAVLAFDPAVKIHAERPLGRQALDHPHIADRRGRPVSLTETNGKRFAVAPRQVLRLARRIGQRQRAGQTVRPGAHDVGDRLFQHGAVDIGCRASGTPDDKMYPHQRAFREKRIKRRHVTMESAGKIGADRFADVAVVTFARHEHQNRNETVEPVAPCQHAHPRAFVQLKNDQRKIEKCILVDLK